MEQFLTKVNIYLNIEINSTKSIFGCWCIFCKEFSRYNFDVITIIINLLSLPIVLQLKGSEGAIGFYKLLVKLVAQKPMEFFKNHKDWLGGNGTEKPINATIFPSLIRKNFA